MSDMSEVKIQCSGKTELDPKQIQWNDSNGNGVPEPGEVTSNGGCVSPEVFGCFVEFQKLVQGTRQQKISIIGLDGLAADGAADLRRRIAESPAVGQFDKVIVFIEAVSWSGLKQYSVRIRGWQGKYFKEAKTANLRLDLLNAVNDAMNQLEDPVGMCPSDWRISRIN